MAQQHFYSCVPARMSMFLRTDGFDTFAAARELDEEWIESELAPVLSAKIGKNELDGIRLGTLPPAYFCFFTKTERKLVESRLTYIAKDYTGERPSFLIHSLIASEEEKRALLSDEGRAMLDPSVFVSDIAPFALTSPEARPDENCPDLPFPSVPAPDPGILLEKYPERVIRRLIFAMIASACGKGKPIYITLPGEPKDLSDGALEILNAVYPLFPSPLRAALSFVTYQGEYAKFPQFLIHFLPESAFKVPAERGWLFNMTTSLADGIPDALYRDNEQIADFFFSLIGEPEIRREFLAFFGRVLEKSKPEFELSLKNLTSIVYLYRQTSGRYDEKKILPDDDAVYDLLCRYEKHRTALSPKERAVTLSVIGRYLKAHVQIPKNSFGKIAKFYPTEPSEAKRAVMRILLDMIHTDIMRDKIFRFIAQVYATEPADSRAEIAESLIRVFYGGFLQNQILRLLAENFAGESEHTQDLIVGKLILSIRTAAIQDAILDFFRSFYPDLTGKQKEKFYAMVWEMLPAADSLAGKLIGFLDRYLPEEDEAFRAAAGEKMLELVASEQRRKTHKMLPLLLKTPGFCRQTVSRAILGKWKDQRIFREFFENEFSVGFDEQISRVIALWGEHPYLPDEAAEKIFSILSEHIRDDTKTTVYPYLDAEAKLGEELKGKYNAVCDGFCDRLIRDAIHPKIAALIEDAFRAELREDGPEFLLAYAEEHPYLKESENFAILSEFAQAMAYAEEGRRAEEVLERLLIAAELCKKPERVFAAAIKRAEPLCRKDSPNAISLYAALRIENGYRKSRELLLTAAADAILPAVGGQSDGETGQKQEKTNASADRKTAILLVADAAVALRRCAVAEELKAALAGETEGAEAFFALLNGAWQKLLPADRASLKADLAALPDEELAACFGKVYDRVEKANRKGFFAKLFGR